MRLILGLLLVLLSVQPSTAAERLALVIGNGSYGAIGRLANPVNDAGLIADSLRRAGFEVMLVTDAGEDAMKRAIVDFGRRLRAGPRTATGLFYFAGHGVQAGGRNYLLPVDGDISDEADLDIEAVPADWVLGQMESAGNASNIVVLDACRNNPFARSFRSVERGLARMDAPTGSFLAYATAPGDVAADGTGANSPYSAALARAMLVPGLPIEQLFKQVRIEVLDVTGGRQTPWESSSLVGDFYFRPASAGATPSAAGVAFEPVPVASVPLDARLSSPQPAQGGDASAIRLSVSTDYSRGNSSNCMSENLGEVEVPLGGQAVRIRSSSHHGVQMDVSATRERKGALVKLSMVGTGNNVDPIELYLDSLSPGQSAMQRSRVLNPALVTCGGIIAYVEVAN